MSAFEIRVQRQIRRTVNLSPVTRGSNTHYALHRRRREDSLDPQKDAPSPRRNNFVRQLEMGSETEDRFFPTWDVAAAAEEHAINVAEYREIEACGQYLRDTGVFHMYEDERSAQPHRIPDTDWAASYEDDEPEDHPPHDTLTDSGYYTFMLNPCGRRKACLDSERIENGQRLSRHFTLY